MLKLGLLSTARINDEILAAAAASGEVAVVAVGSRDAARAADYVRAHGIPRAHGSYEELLADPSVDAVYVSLPNALHHRWTIRALEAGKHVLCEKPYSLHPAEVTDAFDLAAGSGLVLMEAFMYRHHPQIDLLTREVAGGAVGRLRAVRAAFTFRLARPGDVRLSRELDGGALMDVGCYCVSGARLLAGEPLTVTGASVVGETGVDLEFVGILRFPDDVLAQFHCSFRLPRYQVLEVVGDEGSVLVEAPWRADWGGALVVRRAGSAPERIDIPSTSSYRRQLENFARAVAGRADALLGRADALGQAGTLAALARSAAERRVVDLE